MQITKYHSFLYKFHEEICLCLLYSHKALVIKSERVYIKKPSILIRHALWIDHREMQYKTQINGRPMPGSAPKEKGLFIECRHLWPYRIYVRRVHGISDLISASSLFEFMPLFFENEYLITAEFSLNMQQKALNAGNLLRTSSPHASLCQSE